MPFFLIARSQNANELYLNNMAVGCNYQAASFVVDTAAPGAEVQRAFLLWSRNVSRGALQRLLSVDEFGPTGDFISEHRSRQDSVVFSNLLPKRIIRSRFFKGYYMLADVIKPRSLEKRVYSTAVVIKIDDALRLVWAHSIHFAHIDSKNINSLIEYNDMIEADNSDLVLAGRLRYVFSRSPTQVLVTRLREADGSIVWNYEYNCKPYCDAVALSLAEAKDRKIVLSGYINECSSQTHAVTRKLLFMAVSEFGTPLMARLMGGRMPLTGSRILQHMDERGEAFFVAGFADVPGTGAADRQVLVADIREDGTLKGAWHIGAAGFDSASDMTFSYLGGLDYYLYLTGATSRNLRAPKSRDPFFLQLIYKAGTMDFVEFSVFTRPDRHYLSGSGVEIKKAGKERFAILENVLYNTGILVPFQGNFTNMLIRDLKDTTLSCIRKYRVPVKGYELPSRQIPADSSNPNFAYYRENYKVGGKVLQKPQCGRLFIDAKHPGE